MGKVCYRKLNTLRLFGLKMFTFQSDYIEHSTDEEASDDDFYIGLAERENTRREE